MDAQDAAAAVVPLSIASIAVVLGAAALVAVVHLAGIGRIGRNRLAGIRTRTLMASDEAWLRGHRAATPVSWLTGAIAVLAGLGALAAVVGGSVQGGLVLLALAVISMTLGAVLGAWRAHATVR